MRRMLDQNPEKKMDDCKVRVPILRARPEHSKTFLFLM